MIGGGCEMEIKRINQAEAFEIIDNREPIGMFYHRAGEMFVGIDNSIGDAFTEDFKSLDECLKWLRGEDDHGTDGAGA